MTKKILKKLTTILTVLALTIVTAVIPTFALEPNKNNNFSSEGDIVTIVKADGIIPYSYIDPAAFTFTGSNRGSTRTMDSRYLAYEVSISNTSANYVRIETWIDGSRIRSDNIAGNSSAKVDWIDMGYNGNHRVQFIYYTNPGSVKATVNMKMYSWN